jgi:hypothetical protein
MKHNIHFLVCAILLMNSYKLFAQSSPQNNFADSITNVIHDNFYAKCAQIEAANNYVFKDSMNGETENSEYWTWKAYWQKRLPVNATEVIDFPNAYKYLMQKRECNNCIYGKPTNSKGVDLFCGKGYFWMVT